MEQAGDVLASRGRVFQEEQVPRCILSEISNGREGRAVARAAEVDVGVAKDAVTLGAGARTGKEIDNQ